MAKGHRKKARAVAITIRLDEDTFAQINGLATAEGTSFAEQVRILLEWGLMEVAKDEDIFRQVCNLLNPVLGDKVLAVIPPPL